MAEADEEFLQQLREAFAIEAREHLQALSDGLLELEKERAPEQQRGRVETIFREAHSLKGAARSVNREDIEAVCQEMEQVFARWKNQGVQAGPETFDTLGQAVDFVDSLIAEPAADRQQVTALVQRLRALEKGAPPAEAAPTPVSAEPAREAPDRPAAETIRIATTKMDALLLQAEEMIVVKNIAHQRTVELETVGRMMEGWRKEWSKADAELQSVRTAAVRTEQPRLFEFLEGNHTYLRALDHRITALAQSAKADQRLIGGMIDALLEETKHMAMLPFSTLLDLFPKQVRDLARDEGKQIELTIRGREVEIDKRILEQMKDPLVHLVRNAVDHGIEKPGARAAQGKPARATITLAVAQIDAGKVEIALSDDGGGIDAEKVKSSAIKAGSLSPDEAAHCSEREALRLIFHSGVSTSAMITEISGRGLGMAIVREKVEALGGHVEIETSNGRGTTFRIVLPVTLATFKGLLVGAAGEQFILPIANIERVLRLPAEKVRTVENKETIAWEGRAISLARFDSVLGLTRREKKEETKWLQAVILGAGETRIAFVVDEVSGEEEVLVKPLQKPLVHLRNIAAATVLGSGETVLILNIPELLQSASAQTGTVLSAASSSLAEPARSILVTDDSVTSRMLLKNILEAAGYEVKTAIDGVDALAVLKTQPFAAVVSDVQMPRMDGFDLTAKIRADPRLSELPVILVTALESPEHRERGFDVGANAYIVKSSFDQSKLLDVLKRFA